MKKIIIIGVAGAGKTTLAKALSEKLSIPHTELDSLHNQANWRTISKDEFRDTVRTISANDSWIFCGNYFSILGLELWNRADTVIWCDYSFPLVLNRLLRRTVRRIVTKQILWNGNRETFVVSFASKDSIILWMLRSWNKQKRRYGPIFSHPEDLPDINLVHLQSPRATVEFLNRVR